MALTWPRDDPLRLPQPLPQGRVRGHLADPVWDRWLFIAFCGQGGDYALDASVDVTAAYRWALIIHGAYFIQLPFSFELLLTVRR